MALGLLSGCPPPVPQGGLVSPCPALALQTHRSAFQCLQRYQQHYPALKRREWTEEEDRMLTRLVQAMRVGSHIPYRRSESHTCRAGPWSTWGGGGGAVTSGPPAVSSLWSAWLLSGGPRKHGANQPPLSAVVYYMEGRDSMQLIYRWTKSLDPSLRKGLWAPEEDAVCLGPGAWSSGWTGLGRL